MMKKILEQEAQRSYSMVSNKQTPKARPVKNAKLEKELSFIASKVHNEHQLFINQLERMKAEALRTDERNVPKRNIRISLKKGNNRSSETRELEEYDFSSTLDGADTEIPSASKFIALASKTKKKE